MNAIIARLTAATGKQILGGGFGLFIVAALVGVLLIGHARAVSKSYDDGAASRQTEVDTLTTERDTARSELSTTKVDLETCRFNNRQAEADLGSAKSKLAAQADEYKEKLRLQAETFDAAQRANRNAMDSLARANENNKVDFSEIFEGMKGLSYVYDPTTDRCVISGGANQLRNAARGKIQR